MDAQSEAIEAFATHFYPADSPEAQQIREASREMGLFLPLTEAQRASLSDRPAELDQLLDAIASEIAQPPAPQRDV